MTALLAAFLFATPAAAEFTPFPANTKLNIDVNFRNLDEEIRRLQRNISNISTGAAVTNNIFVGSGTSSSPLDLAYNPALCTRVSSNGIVCTMQDVTITRTLVNQTTVYFANVPVYASTPTTYVPFRLVFGTTYYDTTWDGFMDGGYVFKMPDSNGFLETIDRAIIFDIDTLGDAANEGVGIQAIRPRAGGYTDLHLSGRGGGVIIGGHSPIPYETSAGLNVVGDIVVGNGSSPSIAVTTITTAGNIKTRGFITADRSSITAVSFFGDGSHLTGIPSTASISGSYIAIGAAAGGVLAGTLPNPTLGSVVVLSTHIAQGAIETGHIISGAVNTGKIIVGAIDTNRHGPDSVTSVKIIKGAIETGHLTSGAVQTQHILSGAVETRHLLAGVVETRHIAMGSINSHKLADASVDTAKLRDGSVNTSKILAGAIETKHLLAGVINTYHIQMGAVQNYQIASNAVDTSKISDAAINTAKMIGTGATSGQVITYDGSKVGWATPSTGMGGSGTTNRHPKFTAATTLGDSSIFDTGSLVTVNSSMTVTGLLNANGGIATNSGTGSFVVIKATSASTTELAEFQSSGGTKFLKVYPNGSFNARGSSATLVVAENFYGADLDTTLPIGGKTLVVRQYLDASIGAFGDSLAALSVQAMNAGGGQATGRLFEALGSTTGAVGSHTDVFVVRMDGSVYVGKGGNGNDYGKLAVNAASTGAQLTDPFTVGTGTFTVKNSGLLNFAAFASAKINTQITPYAGAVVQCSDCAKPYTICVGTGTVIGQWREQGTATGCY